MSKGMPFHKMNGLGNAIVIVDLRGEWWQFDAAQARAIAARPTSRFDQMMVLHDAPEPGTEAYVRIYNADGSEAEACGKSGGPAQWRFGDTVLANRLIEDHWKRAHRHVSYPRSTAELIQYSRGMLHGNLVRSRSLDTLIVVKLCHAVLCAS